MEPTRRQYLGALVGSASIAAAGCVDGDDSEETENEEPSSELRINGEVLNLSFPMGLYEPVTDNRVAEVHWHGADFSHWHLSPLELPLEGWKAYEIRLHDEDMEAIPLGPGEQFQTEVLRTEDTPEDLVGIEVAGDLVSIRGENEGGGNLVFQVLSDDEVVWTTPALPIEVSDEYEPF